LLGVVHRPRAPRAIWGAAFHARFSGRALQPQVASLDGERSAPPGRCAFANAGMTFSFSRPSRSSFRVRRRTGGMRKTEDQSSVSCARSR